MLKLYDYQQRVLDAMHKHYATLASVPQGGGKTVITAQFLKETEDTNKVVLIVAPKNVFRTWQETLDNQFGAPVRFVKITNPEQADEFVRGVPGYYIMTWQFLARKDFGAFNNAKPDVIILDEVHKMQNRKSKSWDNLRNVKPKHNKIALSGTFSNNKIEGAYTTLRWLWPYTDEQHENGYYQTPLSFWVWAYDWLNVLEPRAWQKWYDIDGERFEVGTMLSYYENYVRVDESELPKVPEVIVEKHIINMLPQQQAMYRDMEKNGALIANGKGIVSNGSAVQWGRLRTITLGIPTLNENDKPVFLSDTVLNLSPTAQDALSEARKADGGVIVFTHDRSWAEAVAEAFTSAGVRSYAWVGGTKQAEREAVLEKFGEPDGHKVIVCVVAAIAEGTDGMQHKAWTEYWASISSNATHNAQARRRLPRDGQKHDVKRIIAVRPGTLDQGIYNNQSIRLKEMEDFYNAGQ